MIDATHLAEVNLALALDSGHLRALQRLPAPHAQIRLLRSFDPDQSWHADSLDVEDPYYGQLADFETVYQQVQAAAPGIVSFVRSQLPT